MGTRADFYVGRDQNAEWLGSVAWDGYPSGIEEDTKALEATQEAEFRALVAELLAKREDATLPERGWPWPWNDSATTDYAYAFDADRVYGSCFGAPWFVTSQGEPEEGEERDLFGVPDFPDMSARKNVRLDEGSGIIII